MSEWLKTLVGYMLIVSVSIQMLPKEKYEQYIRLFTGFLLIIFVIQPLLKLGSLEGYLENKILEFVNEQERMEQEIGREGELFLQESIVYEEQGESEIGSVKIEKVEVNLDD